MSMYSRRFVKKMLYKRKPKLFHTSHQFFLPKFKNPETEGNQVIPLKLHIRNYSQNMTEDIIEPKTSTAGNSGFRRPFTNDNLSTALTPKHIQVREISKESIKNTECNHFTFLSFTCLTVLKFSQNSKARVHQLSDGCHSERYHSAAY